MIFVQGKEIWAALPVLPVIAELKLRKARLSDKNYHESLVKEAMQSLFATEGASFAQDRQMAALKIEEKKSVLHPECSE